MRAFLKFERVFPNRSGFSIGKCVFPFIYVISVLLHPLRACHPDSHEFHRCLHVFLERDFVQVESYLDQYNSVRARRVLMEGPTLTEICEKIKELDMCLEFESVHGCFGFYDLEPMGRLLHALGATFNYFCSGEKDNLKAFLKHGGCVLEFQRELTECRDSAIDWPIVWARIFRLQVGHEICDRMYAQSECVVRHLSRSTCDIESVSVYNETMITWLDNWCNAGYGPSPNLNLLICLIIVLLKTLTCFQL